LRLVSKSPRFGTASLNQLCERFLRQWSLVSLPVGAVSGRGSWLVRFNRIASIDVAIDRYYGENAVIFLGKESDQAAPQAAAK
jgi:hypothetical protein